jgi:hypothetical protein
MGLKAFLGAYHRLVRGAGRDREGLFIEDDVEVRALLTNLVRAEEEFCML